MFLSRVVSTGSFHHRLKRLAGGILIVSLFLGAQTAAASGTTPANILISEAKPPSDAYQQPVIAVDPKRAGHLAIGYQEGSHFNRCYLALSSDSGATWKSSALIGIGATHALPATVTHCQNPLVSFAPDGTLYYGFQDSGFRRLEPDSIHVLLMTSTDGGATFSDAQVLDPQAATPNDWYPAIASSRDGKQTYFAWSRYAQNFNVFPGYPVVTSSSDRGRTFNPLVPLMPRDSTRYVGGPVIAVGADERVYVAFLPSPPGPFSFAVGELQVAYSGDRGTSFGVSSLGQVVASKGCAPGPTVCKKMRPSVDIESIATGPRKGQVYAAWWDDRGPDELARLSFASSGDGGATWAASRIIGVPPEGELHQQHRPQLAVSQDGHLYVAYYDLAPDGSENVLMISSADGGTHFTAPKHLNDVAHDATVGPGTGGRATANLGNHFGLVATDGQVFAAWTDTRRGTVTTGHQDVVFVALSVAAPASGLAGWAAALLAVGAVLIAAVLVGIVFSRRRRRTATP
ncbi:MAG: hypothetical protein NVS1B3_02220 [Candidatus Dormibacteraceae bacterium]